MDSNKKGDIALVKIVSCLIEKDSEIFIPFNDKPRADLVVILNSKTHRLQVKYSKSGYCPKSSSNVKYSKDDIDYFALYLSEIDKVVFLPVELGISYVQYKKTYNTPVWWWEDFIEFNTEQTKRKPEYKYIERNNIRPSREKLKKEVWEKPIIAVAEDYGVSDKAVHKWCSFHSIEKPPRGYWLKKRKDKA
jgi:hypothetical protein